MCLLAAAGAVVLPYSWMNSIHEWLGFGTLPDSPLVGYLTRSLSALYAFLGALSWHLASDLRRYLPALRFTVLLSFSFSFTLIGIDWMVAMPTWWTAVEGSFLLGWTLALWWLVRRISEPRTK